jgi:hypothetical protein
MTVTENQKRVVIVGATGIGHLANAAGMHGRENGFARLSFLAQEPTQEVSSGRR